MMISVEDALTRILARFSVLPAEVVGLDQGLGRVLAEDVVARVTQPPVAVSSMDGYALRSADAGQTPVTLKVVGRAPAGTAYQGRLGPGEAVRIFTGGPLPEGADSIVIQEDCEAETAAGGEARVLVKAAAEPGRYIRRAGLDFTAGDRGVVAGHRLTARDIGLAAAMNVPWLKVRRRPRIALLTTGDEVVMPGEPIRANQIIGSNGPALGALVRACGGESLHLGIAMDSLESLEQLLAGSRGADLLVTTGGASVGEHDLVQHALERQGLQLDFWKIAMRPGKPLMFGLLGETPVLGLPGNPVSAIVCAALFLRPAMELMLGRPGGGRPADSALLTAGLAANDHRQDYLRARLGRDADGRLTAEPFQAQDSSMLATLAGADCLIVRPPHAPPVTAGASVPVIPLQDGI